jgi:hypothetical protein
LRRDVCSEAVEAVRTGFAGARAHSRKIDAQGAGRAVAKAPGEVVPRIGAVKEAVDEH